MVIYVFGILVIKFLVIICDPSKAGQVLKFDTF
jgi:hypothetical protein